MTSGASTLSAQELFAAVLPQGRSVPVGVPATAFATILNSTDRNLTGCAPSLATAIPATFNYFKTDSSNRIVGARNEAAAIPARGAQSFVFEILASAVVSPQELTLAFRCSDTAPAPVTPGVNTFLFGSDTTPAPDVLSIGSVLSNDGIANIPGTAPPATGVMSVAAINLATDADRDLSVTPVLSDPGLPATVLVCETNPATGACLQTPAASITSRVKLVGSGASAYSVFIQARGAIAFSPAVNRVSLRFLDTGDVIRSATSAALRTREVIAPDVNGNGRWDDVENFSAEMLAQMIPNGGSLNQALGSLQIITQDGLLLSDLTDQAIEFGRRSTLEVACLILETNDAVQVNDLVSALNIAMQSNVDRADTMSVASRRSEDATFSLPAVTASDCN